MHAPKTARGTAAALACLVALLLTAASCGSHPPTAPSPGGNGGNQQPPPNNPPLIDGISIRGTRSSEPADFADIGETVNVSATVHDDETAADQLQYEWTAAVGTFDGSGAKVTWTAPADLAGSASSDVTITLKVVEKYGTGAQAAQHEVSSSRTLSLHDSKKEIGDMARQFLLDFSDSTIRDVPYIMRNFTEATKPCRDGKSEESAEISDNRVKYRINESSIGAATVSVKFGSLCPFRARGGDACAQVPVRWKSTVLTSGGTTPAGGTETVFGTDQVTAIYVADQKKWGLCESDFDGQQALTSSFIR